MISPTQKRIQTFRRQGRGRQQPEADRGSAESSVLYQTEREKHLTLEERRWRQSLSS